MIVRMEKIDMKKFLVLMLSLIIVLSFAACDEKSGSGSGADSSDIPSKILKTVNEYCEEEGYTVGSLKMEFEWSGEITDDGPYEGCHGDVYLLSGKIKDVEDEDYQEYKGGYVIISVEVFDNEETECYIIGEFEKTEKQFFEDTLELRVDEWHEIYQEDDN